MKLVSKMNFLNDRHILGLTDEVSWSSPLADPPHTPSLVDSQTFQGDDHTTDEGLGESVGDSSQQNNSEATGEGDSGSCEGDDSGIPPQAGSSGHPNKPMVLKLHLLLNGKQVGVVFPSVMWKCVMVLWNALRCLISSVNVLVLSLECSCCLYLQEIQNSNSEF